MRLGREKSRADPSRDKRVKYSMCGLQGWILLQDMVVFFLTAVTKLPYFVRHYTVGPLIRHGFDRTRSRGLGVVKRVFFIQTEGN